MFKIKLKDMDKNKENIIRQYLKFRTMKLNFIEKYILQLITILHSMHLYLLYVLKTYLGEDLRNVEVPIVRNQETQTGQIYIIYIEKNDANCVSGPLMKILWTWKYTGFDIEALRNNGKYTIVSFKHHWKYYNLFINVDDGKYYFYDIMLERKSRIFDITFGQIEFDLDF